MTKAKPKPKARKQAQPPARRSGRGIPFTPTPQDREKVKAYAAVGVPADQIALVLRIAESTVKKHFALELRTGGIEATAQVGGALFKLALSGNPTACIFWMKTRARWKEADRLEVEHSGAVGSYDLTGLDDKELKQLERTLAKLEAAKGGPDPDDSPG